MMAGPLSHMYRPIFCTSTIIALTGKFASCDHATLKKYLNIKLDLQIAVVHNCLKYNGPIIISQRVMVLLRLQHDLVNSVTW